MFVWWIIWGCISFLSLPGKYWHDRYKQGTRGKCKFKIKPSVWRSGNYIAINLLLLFSFCSSGYKSGKRRMPQDIAMCLLQPGLPNELSQGLKDHDSRKWFSSTYFAPYVPAVEVPTKCAQAMICCQDEGCCCSAFQHLCWGEWLQKLQKSVGFPLSWECRVGWTCQAAQQKGERHQRQLKVSVEFAEFENTWTDPVRVGQYSQKKNAVKYRGGKTQHKHVLGRKTFCFWRMQ